MARRWPTAAEPAMHTKPSQCGQRNRRKCQQLYFLGSGKRVPTPQPVDCPLRHATPHWRMQKRKLPQSQEHIEQQTLFEHKIVRSNQE